MLVLCIAMLFGAYHFYQWVIEFINLSFPNEKIEDPEKETEIILFALRHPWTVCFLAPAWEEVEYFYLIGIVLCFCGFDASFLLWLVVVVQAAFFAAGHEWSSWYKRVLYFFPRGLLHGTILVMVLSEYQTYAVAPAVYACLIAKHCFNNFKEYVRLGRLARKQIPKKAFSK